MNGVVGVGPADNRQANRIAVGVELLGEDPQAVAVLTLRLPGNIEPVSLVQGTDGGRVLTAFVMGIDPEFIGDRVPVGIERPDEDVCIGAVTAGVGRLPRNEEPAAVRIFDDRRSLLIALARFIDLESVTEGNGTCWCAELVLDDLEPPREDAAAVAIAAQFLPGDDERVAVVGNDAVHRRVRLIARGIRIDGEGNVDRVKSRVEQAKPDRLSASSDVFRFPRNGDA